jgi:tetratricopeptide (TPR) repeat protein
MRYLPLSGMITLLALLATAAIPAAAPNRPGDWVGYQSRETASGPQLVVDFEEGPPQTYAAEADAVLISYLADRNWGRLPTLSIDLADANRVLLRFAPPAGGRVRKAELVLRRSERLPQLPPQPFAVAFHEVTAAWEEGRVTWASQPPFAEQPAAVAKVDPQAVEVRLDVTPLVRRLLAKEAPGHGWLLRAAEPLRTDGPTPGMMAGPEADLLKLLPWEDTVPAALERARGEGKLVLASVRSHPQPDKTTFAEQVLLAAVLADPDVQTLVLQRFVPVRVSYTPVTYVAAVDGHAPRFDVLAGLGTTTADVKAPALVVSDAAGNLVARLTSIGTFDRDLTLRFLLGSLARAAKPAEEKDPWKLLAAGRLDEAEQAFTRMNSREGSYGLCRVASLRGQHAAALRLAEPLAKSEGPFRHEAAVEAGLALLRLGRFPEAVAALREAVRSPAGSRAAEAAYALGCVLYRLRDGDGARAAWQAVARQHPRSASAVRARARLAWPDALAMFENLTGLDRPGEPGGTEVDFSADEAGAVRRGIEFLLAHQAADGSWSSAGHAETYRVAITALAARALHAWGAAVEGARRERAARAVGRATAWLDRQITAADPASLDSFGAAYLLDYFLDLEEAKAATRGNVAGAIRLLLGGQCPNGGWSYSVVFGVNWQRPADAPPKYTGRTHSMNTGAALLALARAKERGHAVEPRALESGRKALRAMRAGPGVYSYTAPGPPSFNQPDMSIGRGPVCEQGLCLLGDVPRDDLEAAVQTFLKYRHDLRKSVKLWGETWLPPRCYSSYFFFFAYDHAARAITYQSKDARERLNALRADILRMTEVDGTWVDWEVGGKTYGTAMALHILALARQAR